MLSLAMRLLWRDLRAGELRILLVALALAVASVTAVGFFTENVRASLASNARELMGADLVLVSDHPVADEYRARATAQGLRTAETRSFPSVVRFGERLQLADIKAVSPDYPLRGRLEADQQEAPGGPAAGSVWLEPRLVDALLAQPGARLAIGQREFTFAATLTNEPDRAFNFFSLAPHLMMRLDDLETTGLIGPGARVSYRFLIAGDAVQVEAFQRWVEARLGRGERLEDVRNARPELRSALNQADRFLGLSAVITLVLSAVAVALASRRYFQRHLDACAIMRCLGLTQPRLLVLHALQFVVLALIAVAIGSLAGYGVHLLLMRLLLGDLMALPATVGAATWPILQGALSAAVLLAGFAGLPLLRLARVPAIRVFRREFGALQASFALGQLAGMAMLAGLAILMAGDVKLGLLSFAGFALMAAVLVVVSRGLILTFARLAMHFGRGLWRHGMANLRRHAQRTSLLVAALTIGFAAIFLLTAVRDQILAQWQTSLPADAPNTFIINIQPDQRVALAQQLQQQGIPAAMRPMIRARLLAIGEQPVSAASFADDERASRLVEREFNLSWQADLPEGNEIVAGQWFAGGQAGDEASVEAGLAETLGIRLGDTLTFSIDGEARRLKVTSLRKLSWGSMRVNFFVIVPPGVLEDAPASYITSFFAPPGDERLGAQLLVRFPNLTVIDIGAALAQVRHAIERIAGSVELIFLLTLLAGAIVLEAAMWASLDERRHEIAVMRTLGARQRDIRSLLIIELAAAGVLAGLLATLCATVLGQLLAQRIFGMALSFDGRLLLAAVAGGVVFSLLSGYWAIRKVLQTPPTQVLRAVA